MTIQLKAIKVAGFQAATAALLATAIETFFRDAGEATLVTVHYAESAGVFSALVLYTT